MLNRLRRLRQDERGFSFVFLALTFMAFLVATTLAIDVGMFMTARSQAQNAADSGALSGAVALVFDSYTDRSPTGPAVQSALAAATANQVMAQNVSITPADVTFPNDPEGNPNWVHVQVFRTGARGNPVATLMGVYFRVPTVNISATATAEAAPANAATCVKPWAIPDKWIERQGPPQIQPWDPSDTFDMYDQHGNPLPTPDIYRGLTDPGGYTGFNFDRAGPDYGVEVLLKAGNPHDAIDPSHYFPIALPPNTGASWYEQNIPGCWPGVMQFGDSPPVEPGNMTGPTVKGTQDLIDKDPTAYWDTVQKRVISSYNPSPRIVILPVFDPIVYEESRQRGRQDIVVANLVGFFIEDLQSNAVLGRLVPTTGLIRGGTPVPNGAYLRAIRLVQ
jgi:Flp pilus assembly protein TadG